MKPKHYPLLTAAIGAALALIPGILLIIVMHSSDDSEVNAVIDQYLAQAQKSSIGSEASIRREEQGAPVSVGTEQKKTSTSSVPQVAMATEDRTPLPEVMSAPAMSSVAAGTSAAAPVVESSQEPVSELVPAPAEIQPADPLFSAADDSDDPADSPEMIEIPRRPDVADSYYDATGHMALISQGQVNDPVAGAPPAVDKKTGEPAAPKSETKNGAKSEAPGKNDSKRGSSRRRTKKDETETAKSSDATTAAPATTMAPTGNPFLDGSGSMPKRATGQSGVDPALIEDVVINTPAENSHVNRVEDVVAATTAKGWPIALIRSDLPDDVWWVQQVIGIQGNAFGARVNFGNEYTVHGSAYRMVIVFLDSPDEVRRFRIAKQFKQIPAGVRRSREFHYIRK
jgi:hypothetical protein